MMELKSKEEFFREAGYRSLSFSHPKKEKARRVAKPITGINIFTAKSRS